MNSAASGELSQNLTLNSNQNPKRIKMQSIEETVVLEDGKMLGAGKFNLIDCKIYFSLLISKNKEGFEPLFRRLRLSLVRWSK